GPQPSADLRAEARVPLAKSAARAVAESAEARLEPVPTDTATLRDGVREVVTAGDDRPVMGANRAAVERLQTVTGLARREVQTRPLARPAEPQSPAPQMRQLRLEQETRGLPFGASHPGGAGGG